MSALGRGRRSSFGPLDRAPGMVRPPFGPASRSVRFPEAAERAAALRTGLLGVALGPHDERIVTWLAGWSPNEVGTVCSWLHRVRLTGYAEGHTAALNAVLRGHTTTSTSTTSHSGDESTRPGGPTAKSSHRDGLTTSGTDRNSQDGTEGESR